MIAHICLHHFDNFTILKAILDVVVNLQFSMVEALWHTFWRAPLLEDESKQDSQTPWFVNCST